MTPIMTVARMKPGEEFATETRKRWVEPRLERIDTEAMRARVAGALMRREGPPTVK